MPGWFDEFEQSNPDILADGSWQDYANRGGVTGDTAPVVAPAQAAQAAPALSREDWRDQWMGSGPLTPQQADARLRELGATEVSGRSGVWRTPHGEILDVQIGRQGALASGGTITPGWTRTDGGGGGGGGAAGGAGGRVSGYGGYGGGGAPGSGTTMPEAFTYTPQAMPTAYQPGQIAAPQALNVSQIERPATITADRFAQPGAYSSERFNAPGAFVAPTAEEALNDPGYRFRLAQGQQALENRASAQGLLRTGGFAKGMEQYAQDMASQEYANVYGRRLGEYQTQFGNTLAANQANNAAAAQAYGLTTGAQLGAYQANTANQLTAQQANAQYGLAAQQANAANQISAYNAYQPLATQVQLANEANRAGAAQQNFANQFTVGQTNESNRLGAYQANVNAALGLGNLNLGYTQAANNYDLGQGQLGLGYGNLALNQQGQQFNQGLSTWQANQGANQQAWQNQFSLAQLGQNSALNYGNQAGNLYTNQGNANAAAQVGAANAWGGALNNIGNQAQDWAAWYGTQPRTPGTPIQAGGY